MVRSRPRGNGFIIILDKRRESSVGAMIEIDEIFHQQDTAPCRDHVVQPALRAGRAPAVHRPRQPEGRRRQDHDRDQSRHFALAAIGERVLIVDLDPQGNASTGLGIDRRSRNDLDL